MRISMGVSNENYDVFYSNADGTFNLHGDCVTIEAVYPRAAPSGGGLNIAEVQFNFGSTSAFSRGLCSSLQLGNNAIPGSEVNAVDGNLSTFSTMGSTVNYPNDPTRLRLTVLPPGIPEPSTLTLVGLATALLLTARRWRKHRSSRVKAC
jgi:PEP-CTERM motif